MSNLGTQIFEAHRALGALEEKLCDFIDELFGKEGWTDFDFDPYDKSLEIYGVPEGVKLTGDGLTRICVAGFDRIWLHVGSERRQPGERYYSRCAL